MQMRDHFLRLIKPKGHFHRIGMIHKSVFYIFTDIGQSTALHLEKNSVLSSSDLMSVLSNWQFLSVFLCSWTISLFLCRHFFFFLVLSQWLFFFFFNYMQNVLEPVSQFFTSVFLPSISMHARLHVLCYHFCPLTVVLWKLKAVLYRSVLPVC